MILLRNYKKYLTKKFFCSFFNSLKDSSLVFPIIILAIILILSAFNISGSSIGQYYKYFNGNSTDSNLLLNRPREIRSDEWLVNTQLTLAQATSGFPRINPNIGDGQDMSVIVDVPYKEWSAIFKPHNLPFLFLPVQTAFAFKWWLLAFFLLLAVYLFTLEILPNKRLIASLVAISFLFNPFVQWWYQYITLGPIYYSLLIAVVYINLLKSNTIKSKIGLSILLSYLIVCFAIVQYPAFQIACGVGLAIFLLGYTTDYLLRDKAKRDGFIRLFPITISLVVGILIVAIFIFTRLDTVKTINDTAYPGKRSIDSGGFDFIHTFSGHLSHQLQYGSKSSYYTVENKPTNQSEASNFIFVFPYILPVLIGAALKSGQRLKFTLLGIVTSILLYLSWLFIPGLHLIGKALLFSKVPQNRMLIGLGMLNLIGFIYFIKIHSDSRNKQFYAKKYLWGSVLFAFILQFLTGLMVHMKTPSFIGLWFSIILALPITLAIYLIYYKRYAISLLIISLFSVFSSGAVHPIYRNIPIINTELSSSIKDIEKKYPDAVWATEDIYIENFAIINSAKSISGVYTYPQLKLWEDIGAPVDVYNRYAHVTFLFDRNANIIKPTAIKQPGGDSFIVETEPCSKFIKDSKINYILTVSSLDEKDKCIKLVKIVKYSQKELFIYNLSNN